MEECSKSSFLGLCKQYDRLTPDGKQAILMKVSRRVTEAVETVKRGTQQQMPLQNGTKKN